jgi:hypothetical protein
MIKTTKAKHTPLEWLGVALFMVIATPIFIVHHFLIIMRERL